MNSASIDSASIDRQLLFLQKLYARKKRVDVPRVSGAASCIYWNYGEYTPARNLFAPGTPEHKAFRKGWDDVLDYFARQLLKNMLKGQKA